MKYLFLGYSLTTKIYYIWNIMLLNRDFRDLLAKWNDSTLQATAGFNSFCIQEKYKTL